MTMIAANLSVSLDGYFAGPDANPTRMLGVGGDVLHGWFAHDVGDRAQLSGEDVLRPEFERMGAMVMGRDSYEIAEAAWGSHPPFEVPIFVLTHRGRAEDVREKTTFTFATEGFDAAIDQARRAAAGKDVMLHGGSAIQQGLRAQVLDELQLHVVPVLLGGGRRLLEHFGDQRIDLERVRTLEGPGVTHLKYRVGATENRGSS